MADKEKKFTRYSDSITVEIAKVYDGYLNLFFIVERQKNGNYWFREVHPKSPNILTQPFFRMDIFIRLGGYQGLEHKMKRSPIKSLEDFVATEKALNEIRKEFHENHPTFMSEVWENSQFKEYHARQLRAINRTSGLSFLH